MYSWIMKQTEAIKSLSAMAHDGRLTLLRVLIVAGEKGVGAGDLSLKAGVATTTASAQLAALSHANLVTSTRQGRAVTYYANYTHLNHLMTFLLRDCCQGHKDVCANLLERM